MKGQSDEAHPFVPLSLYPCLFLYPQLPEALAWLCLIISRWSKP